MLPDRVSKPGPLTYESSKSDGNDLEPPHLFPHPTPNTKWERKTIKISHKVKQHKRKAKKSGPEDINKLFMLNSAEHEI